MNITCPACHGRGLKHWHPYWDNGHAPCTTCAGTGKIEDTDMTDLHHPRTAGEAVHRDKPLIDEQSEMPDRIYTDTGRVWYDDDDGGALFPYVREPAAQPAPDLIERMERIVRSKYAHRDQLIHDCDIGHITFGDVRDLCDAIRAITAAQPAQRVKPLVWTEYETEGWDDRADAEAGSFGVFYNIDIQNDGYRVVFDHEAVGCIGTFDTDEDAKAAAQADFDRRILSALEPAAQDGAEVEHVDPVGQDGLEGWMRKQSRDHAMEYPLTSARFGEVADEMRDLNAESTALKSENERLRAKLDRREKWLDSLKLRAESAEARERALLDSHEANRQQMMRNNAALKAEVERIRDVIASRCPFCHGTGTRVSSGGTGGAQVTLWHCDHGLSALRAHEQGGA